MKEATMKVYCCEHCNFVSRFAAATIRHEKFCKKNSNVKPLCYKCKHMYSSGDIECSGILYSRDYRQVKLDGQVVNFKALKCECKKTKFFDPVPRIFNAFKKSEKELAIINNKDAQLYKYEESIEPDGGVVLRHIPRFKEEYLPMPSEVEGCADFEEME